MTTTDTTGLAATIERLAATEDIRALILAYRTHVDARDLKAFSELFTEDGEWIGGSGRATSPAGIYEMLTAVLAPNPPAPGGTSHHLVTNIVIEVDGDRATGWSNWELVARSPLNDTPQYLRSGRYEDVYRRENGAWKFRRRIAHLDIPHKDLGPLPPSSEVS